MIDLNELKKLAEKADEVDPYYTSDVNLLAFERAATPSAVLELIALASAAQESAPAELPPLSIKTWQERGVYAEDAKPDGNAEEAMCEEIADLRAALSRPVVAIPVNWKEQALRQYRHNDGSEGFVFAYDSKVLDRLLAAAPASPQPVAKVLTANHDESK